MHIDLVLENNGSTIAEIETRISETRQVIEIRNFVFYSQSIIGKGKRLLLNALNKNIILYEKKIDGDRNGQIENEIQSFGPSRPDQFYFPALAQTARFK